MYENQTFAVDSKIRQLEMKIDQTKSDLQETRKTLSEEISSVK